MQWKHPQERGGGGVITPPDVTTLAEVLSHRAARDGDRLAFMFLPEGEGTGISISYRELDARACAIAGMLAQYGAGARVLLLYPPGIEFIVAFFGCLYAGVVAVPVYPPRRNRSLDRIKRVAVDCRPVAALTTTDVAALSSAFAEVPELAALPLRLTDTMNVPGALRAPVPVEPDALAFLQYTSGSTGAPKGVMVSHANLMHNEAVMNAAFGFRSDDTAAGWLPMYHDMGLIGMMLHPLYIGIPCIMMPPAAFLKRPVRWLKIMSEYRATISVAPNFALDLCARDIRPEDCAGLDLSHWHFLLCGAEPVRADTLARFSAAFAPYGFRREAIRPAFGLAEGTLLTTIGDGTRGPQVFNADADALDARRFTLASDTTARRRDIVGNGQTWHGMQVAIVNPETRIACAPGAVGEIWIKGDSVARGYWQKPEISEQVFQARIADTNDGPYLRSGDLGLMHDGELVITGRAKDVIILRGRNHYPQDIEWTMDDLAARLGGSSPIQTGAAAAFAIEADGDERLVLVVEGARGLVRAARSDDGAAGAATSAFQILRAEIAHTHEVDMYDAIVIRPGTLPRTSSGKVQRFRARELYLHDGFEVLARLRAAAPKPPEPVPETEIEPAKSVTRPAIDIATVRAWLLERAATVLGVPANSLPADADLAYYGMNSVSAMRLVGELEDWLHVSLPQNLLWEQPSIDQLAAYIATLGPAAAAPETRPIVTADDAARFAPFALNEIQQAYWLGRSDAFVLGGVACQFYTEFETDNLDLARLEAAWQKVIARHDMLRAVIDGDGNQRVLENPGTYRIEVEDLSNATAAEQERSRYSLRAKLSHAVRDTTRWPLFDIRAQRIGPARARLHIGFDLLIADVWSLYLAVGEWELYYRDPAYAPAPLSLRFRDYVAAESVERDTDMMRRARAYWLGRLRTLPDAPKLPLALSPQQIRAPRFTRREASLDADRWKRFCTHAAAQGVTPSMALCAAYAETLSTWSETPHFTINLTLFNRRPIHPEVNALVGDFTSVLLLELGRDAAARESFARYAQAAQTQVRADLEHRAMSGIEVLRELNRGRRGNPAVMPVIFTSALGMNELDQRGTTGTAWFGRRVYGISQTPQVWLDHQVTEDAATGGIVYTWDAVEALFPEGMLDDMYAAYSLRVLRLADDPAAWTQASRALTPARHRGLYVEANDTNAPVPGGLLHDPFRAQVPSKGNLPAVIASTRTLSYRALYQESNQIGAGLRKLGAKPNQLIAIVMEKGWEQVVAAYGILTAGSAYLPIDANLPPDRIRTLLTLGEVRIALTQASVLARIEWPAGVQALCVDNKLFREQPARRPPAVQRATDLAYVIFTSGSTGVPKGVMIDHRGAMNTIVDINERFSVNHRTRALAVSALSFDLSVYDLFGILGAGGAIVLPDADRNTDPEHWADLVARHGVTLWNSAPALMDTFLEFLGAGGAGNTAVLKALRTVMLSGDWIPLSVPKRLHRIAPDAEVISLGGATEASIWSIWFPITEVKPEWRSIPYGKPLKNQRFHVLDADMEARPMWVPGALYIAGVGLAKGYFGDTDKTAERFITHPRGGERLYRTGDLGRYLPDGNIEFLGREDFQLKIQGFRIEPGEIEATLNHHVAVRDSIVTAWVDASGAKHLVAYVLPRLEILRAALRIPCVVDDATSEARLMQALDIASLGTRVTGAPTEWQPGRVLNLNMHLPGCAAPYDFRGTVAWRDGDQAGVAFDESQDSVALLNTCLRHRTRDFRDASLVTAFRYRATDSRRREFRVPLTQQARLTADGRECEIETLNFSADGLRVRGLPADWPARCAIALLLPVDEDRMLLPAEIVWCNEAEAGVRFSVGPFEHALLEEALAHYVKAGDYWLNDANLGQLRDYLAARLPPYMVPRHVVLLDEFPLSVNGKLDRNALPAPALHVADRVAPRTDTEKALAAIWREVLGIEDIGAHDNFFDLGGYSQLAVRLLLKVRERFNTDLPIRALFESPTLEQLARRIAPDESGGASTADGTPIEDSALYGEYARRGIYARIHVIRADKNYVRARGTHLTYREDGAEHEVLDMVGGYGSTLLGHNHPELVRELRRVARDNVPMHAQHTNNIEAGKLGKALSDLIGRYTGRRYVATLASTGTEAIEAAIKHAKMEVKSRADRAMRADQNLLALLVHEVRRERLTLTERVYARAEQLTGRTIAYEPGALTAAILDFNAVVYAREPLFIALAHAFHGMTAGSLSLTASRDFRAPFEWMGVRSQWIEHHAQALNAAVDRETHSLISLEMGVDGLEISSRLWHTVGALFIEPIQGEGGIHVVDREFAAAARALADRRGFPIVADEIQCGMGRSGTFCAAESIGLRADYYTFAKTLGGGVAKIAALMVDAGRYEQDFGYYHGSTFAEDRPGCRIALTTLAIIERDELPARCTRLGERFRQKLNALRARFPDVIADVRGSGLMLGIELAPLEHSSSFLFRALTSNGMEILNYLLAGYLLNKHGVRIAPTKTRNTIRFLPSAYVTEAEMDEVVTAIGRACEMIHLSNPGRLMRYVVEPGYDDTVPVRDWRAHHPAWHDDPVGGERRVAHIGHPETAGALLLAEPSLAEIPAALHEELLARLFPVSRPAVTQQLRIVTATGEAVHLSIIGIPLTGPLFEHMMQGPEREQLVEAVDQALMLARELGCEVVGFGGYTSIVTMNCTTVATTDVALTSGNAFTTAMTIEGLRTASVANGLDPADAVLGVVGARGNIGAVCARVLAKDWHRIRLIGRTGSEDGLRTVAETLYADAWAAIRAGTASGGVARAVAASATGRRMLADRYDSVDAGMVLLTELDKELSGSAPVTIHTSLDAMSGCDAVLTATNSSRPIIFSNHLSGRTKVICDAAVPADVDASVLRDWPTVTVLSGGLVRLPRSPGIQLLGSRLPRDHVYGCVAETALLGVTGCTTHFSFGELLPEQVTYIAEIARRHGFELGALKAHEVVPIPTPVAGSSA